MGQARQRSGCRTAGTGSRHVRSGPMDEMEAIIERYGEVQARYEELDGYGLEGRAREVLAGLSFSQEMMDGDVGRLSAAGRCAWRWPAFS